MNSNLTRIGKSLPLKTIFATCTALSALLPHESFAQLSILGVLDTRAPFQPQRTAPAPQKQPTKTIQSPTTVTPPPRTPYAAPQRDIYSPKATLSNAPRVAFSAEEIGLDKDLGVITARGNVEIIHDDRILIADTVSYNQQENVVTASGNVQIIEPNGNVTLTEYIEISSDLSSGIAQEMSLQLEDRSTISAKSAKRTEGRYTIAQDATYAVCQKCEEDPERPLAWKLSAKEVKHDAKQRRIEYSDLFFEIYDVPVMYFPYFSHPDPTRKRETGLLAPSFGSRGSLEQFIETPVFWNISPSKDLTLAPTWYYNIDQGLLNAEYRQYSNNGEMNLGGSLTYADGGPGARTNSTEEFRGHIDSDGQFDINDTWRWGFDINRATDETYIRRYGIKDNSENSNLITNFYTEGFRHRNYMNANFKLYQEQRDTSSEDLQDGKIELQFNHESEPQKTGAYWTLNGDLYGINRKNQTRSTRLLADTSWVLPYTSPTGDLITLDANLLTAGYFISNFDTPSQTTEYSGFQGRAVPSLSLEWRKPITKSHMNGAANEIFEPIVKVKMAPNVGENNKIPNEDSQDFEFDDTNLFKTNRFTGHDKIDGGQRVDFGAKWGVYGTEGGYTQLFIGQSYRMRDDASYDTNSGHEDNISDVVGRVQARPSDFLDLLYRFRLDKNDMSLNRSETGLTIGPASTRLSVSHLYVEGTGEDSEYGTREEIYGSLTNKISKYWSSSLNGRYRMSAPEGSVSYGGKIDYTDECTTFSLNLSRSFSEDRDIKPNDTITFRVELKNLGGFDLY